MRLPRRSQNGNMLILVSVFMAVAAIAVLLACSYGALFFEANRLQASADEIALAGARKLNENDRIGQMNNMVARCRQLVYCSREIVGEVDPSNERLKELAEQLLQESRESAQDLETERVYLAGLAKTEAIVVMNAKYASVKAGYVMALPWLKVSMPALTNVSANGKLKLVESNVEELKSYDDLTTYDSSQGYLHTYSDLKLYKQNVNAKLPGSDSDLTFKIGSLPAPLGDAAGKNVQVPPARVVLADKFETAGTNVLPSACQVELDLPVNTGLGANGGGISKAVGSACATGGNLL